MSTGPKPERLYPKKAKGFRKHVREKAWRDRKRLEKLGR
jgi:hypothetical protein